MPANAQTIRTYDNSVIREDLAEAYSMIDVEDVVFMDMCSTTTTTSTQFDWPIVDLAAPDSDNRVIEGEDDPDVDDGTLANRLANFTQISDKTIKVSHSSEAVEAAANNVQRLAKQKVLKMIEMRRDKETMLLANVPGSAGSKTAPRQTAGLPAFLRENIQVAPGATAPTLSDGDNGYPNAPWGDGTAPRVFNERMLNTCIQTCWEAGASPSVIMLNGGNKRRLSATFTGNSTRYKDAIDSLLVASVDIYDSDFGRLTVVPNRLQPTLNQATDDDNYAVYVLDPDYLEIAYLETMQSEPIAKTGHSTSELLWCEYGLKIPNQRAHGIIVDTDNTIPA